MNNRELKRIYPNRLKEIYFDTGVYIFEYKKIRNLLLKYKFNNRSYLNKFFGSIILENKKAVGFMKSYDIIIPVPTHKVKFNKRGYNQVALMLKNLNSKKVQEDILLKIKHTKAQSTLSLKQRALNIKNVYYLSNPVKIKNKKVLIIDDVYTTGNTLNECSKVLKENGANYVGILTIAKD